MSQLSCILSLYVLLNVLLPISINYDLLNDDVVVILVDLSNVYKELLELSLIDRVLILNCPFNSYKLRLSTALSLILKPLFPLISIIILIIDIDNKLLTRNPSRYYIICYPYKPK